LCGTTALILYPASIDVKRNCGNQASEAGQKRRGRSHQIPVRLPKGGSKTCQTRK
jgi:hypothetical protein